MHAVVATVIPIAVLGLSCGAIIVLERFFSE